VVRAKITDALCVLASATPSMESLVNAETGRYVHVRLPARAAGAVLPEIELIDLREHPPETGEWISPVLARAAAETLARGEQVMFYLTGVATPRWCCARPAATR